jgi:hypothetical protein
MTMLDHPLSEFLKRFDLVLDGVLLSRPDVTTPRVRYIIKIVSSTGSPEFSLQLTGHPIHTHQSFESGFEVTYQKMQDGLVNPSTLRISMGCCPGQGEAGRAFFMATSLPYFPSPAVVDEGLWKASSTCYPYLAV